MALACESLPPSAHFCCYPVGSTGFGSSDASFFLIVGYLPEFSFFGALVRSMTLDNQVGGMLVFNWGETRPH
jgi:hypothetical protein